MTSCSDEVARLKSEALFRNPAVISGREGVYLIADGQRYLDFSSNDALGLGQNIFSTEAVSGAAASRLVTGNHQVVLSLEESFAAWMGFEKALVFPSGYQANITLLSALFSKDDLVLSDQFNHASIVDGLSLSKCRKKIFPHADLSAVKELIAEECPKAIVIESLYSVEGDFFPLQELIDLIQDKEIILIVDEAHAAAVYGDQFRGLLPDEAITSNVIKVVTCSKSIGAQGGAVLLSEPCCEYLMNKGRGFIFSTGISPVLASLIRKQIQDAQEQSIQRQKLFDTSSYFHKKICDMGFDYRHHEGSHIITIDFDSLEKGAQFRDRLKEAGIWVAYLRYPTVAQGHSRLRFSLSVFHETSHIDQISAVLAS